MERDGVEAEGLCQSQPRPIPVPEFARAALEVLNSASWKLQELDQPPASFDSETGGRCRAVLIRSEADP